jgi:hypothetical protein
MKNLSLMIPSVLLFGVLQISPAYAISCPELHNLWRSTYLREFQVKWDTSVFNCDGLNALFALALFDLQSTRYRPDNRGYAPDFYQMVRQNVRSLSLDPRCGATTLAHTTGREISFCPLFFTDSREERNGTLVHETRHTQNNDPGHVTCARGRLAGQRGSCDGRFYNGAWQGSGYNADIFYYNWTIGAGNNDSLSRDVLQGAINSLIPDRFNTISPYETNAWRR